MSRFVLVPIGLLTAISLLSGCTSYVPIPHVVSVDLDRFMGDWYVIAAVPSRFERDAYNAVESYARLPDGRIQTTFRYRKGSFTGKLKTMHPVGTANPESGNAVWGMQFIWPIQAEYVISYLDPGYQTVIVARTKRDYAWIMARTPTLPAEQYAELVTRLEALGYPAQALRKVPQQWPERTE